MSTLSALCLYNIQNIRTKNTDSIESPNRRHCMYFKMSEKSNKPFSTWLQLRTAVGEDSQCPKNNDSINAKMYKINKICSTVFLFIFIHISTE